jgi:hypothetical protein
MTENVPAGLDQKVPSSARCWNYLLGGKDNFAVDRAIGDAVLADYPAIKHMARASRAFLRRFVTVAADAGIRQFLDLGTGLPTADNTHEVAQRAAHESRIVYVDNDLLVLAHARALLTSAPGGVTDYVDADVRIPEKIVAQATETLDFSRPIAVLMLAILGHVRDDDQPGPAEVVHRLVAAIPSGSYVAINDSIRTPASEAALEVARRHGADYNLRTPTQIGAFLEGLDVVEPGVVPTSLWRPDSDDPAVPLRFQPLDMYCAVGRKP